MSEKLLFRLHKQENEKYAEEIKNFVKYYFDLSNEKVKIIIREFKLDPEFAQPEGKMFDIFIKTSDENKYNIAHACAWSYCQGKKS